jgi:hypothetical protein
MPVAGVSVPLATEEAGEGRLQAARRNRHNNEKKVFPWVGHERFLRENGIIGNRQHGGRSNST